MESSFEQKNQTLNSLFYDICRNITSSISKNYRVIPCQGFPAEFFTCLNERKNGCKQSSFLDSILSFPQIYLVIHLECLQYEIEPSNRESFSNSNSVSQGRTILNPINTMNKNKEQYSIFSQGSTYAEQKQENLFLKCKIKIL